MACSERVAEQLIPAVSCFSHLPSMLDAVRRSLIFIYQDSLQNKPRNCLVAGRITHSKMAKNKMKQRNSNDVPRRTHTPEISSYPPCQRCPASGASYWAATAIFSMPMNLPWRSCDTSCETQALPPRCSSSDSSGLRHPKKPRKSTLEASGCRYRKSRPPKSTCSSSPRRPRISASRSGSS